MGTLVTYRLDGSVATITMADGKVNAMSPRMLADLDGAFDQALADQAAVVLTGGERVFSAGFDLRVLGAGGPDALTMITAGFALAARMLEFPRPVVVACGGHAIAMGAFLLLSGDYRVGVAGSYKIVLNEVEIGIPVPRSGIEIARQRLAPAHFNRAVINAETYPPADAVAAGYLDRVVPAEELPAVAAEVAARLAGLDAGAHATTKLRAREQTLTAIRAALESDAADLRARAAGVVAAGG